jgi:hypothetical protein
MSETKTESTPKETPACCAQDAKAKAAGESGCDCNCNCDPETSASCCA